MIFNKPELVALAADVATKEGIPPEFCCAIIEVLSGWSPSLVEHSLDPQVFNPNISRLAQGNARIGLLQINMDAAKELGYKQSQAELLEPTLNVSVGCKLLKKSLEQVGNNADRALLICYGYSISTMIPRIQEKVRPYRKFLAQRPQMQP